MRDRLWQLWALMNSFGSFQGILMFVSIFFQKYFRKEYLIHSSKSPFGIRLRKNSSDFSIFKQVFLNNEYDFSLPVEPEVIIDCGANVGLTSVYFAWKYKKANIFCIEPDESNFILLKKNTFNYNNIKCLNYGIWNKSTFLKVINPDEGNSSFRLEETSDKKHGIESITIHDLLKVLDVGIVDVLKIDIEGSEMEIFSNGYEAWLPKVRVLVIELHDRFKPGASKAFFKAISMFNFHVEIKGENLICINQELSL